MLESLEATNIKRMSVENPEKEEEVFEIAPKDIESIRTFVESAFENSDWTDAMDALYYGKQLGYEPELTVGLNVPVARLKEGVKLHNTLVTMSELRAYDEALKLFPILDLEHNKEFLEHCITLEKSARSEGRWYDLAFLAEIDPNILSFDPTTAKNDLENITTQTRGFIEKFPSTAVHIAGIIQEFDSNFNLSSFNFDMGKLHEHLVDLKSIGKWPEYLQMLYYLQRLEIKPEPHALLEEKNNSIPEQRNF